MSGNLETFIRSLERRDTLRGPQLSALRSMPHRARVFTKGQAILHAGGRPYHIHLLSEGMAIRYGVAGGKRQISSFEIAGSLLDLSAVLLRRFDQYVDALTDCVVVMVPHAALKQVLTSDPHLARMVYLLLAVDDAKEREGLTGLGRRSSLQNLAHKLCELHVRLLSMGLAGQDGFAFAASQEDVADLLGISTVHANRTIQDLRRTAYVEWHDHQIRVIDAPALADLGQFDPAYLSLVREPR